MSEEKISESTTCMRYIDPKLRDSNWDLEKVVREYSITKGKIVPEGKGGRRNDPLRADYILQVAPNFKIAVIEAKSYDLPHNLPFCNYSTVKTFINIYEIYLEYSLIYLHSVHIGYFIGFIVTK